MHWHKNKITRLYYHLPYTYTLSEILCTQATEHFNHFSYVLNKFLPCPVDPPPSLHWTSANLHTSLCCSWSWRKILSEHQQVILLFGQLPWWTVLSFCFIEAWQCSHGTSISPQSLVTWVSTSFSTSPWLQPLQVAFTFPSNCSAKMLLAWAVCTCGSFFTPFFTSWSAQCRKLGDHMDWRFVGWPSDMYWNGKNQCQVSDVTFVPETTSQKNSTFLTKFHK